MRMINLALAGGLLLALGAAGTATAQSPASMTELGCCCVQLKDNSVGCGQKNQKDCLAEQAKMPTFDKLPDWAKAVEASKAQEAGTMKTGWKVGACSGT